MRPTIINDKIIKAFEKVVNEDINAIILTDDELVLEVNDILNEEDKFSYSAYKDWKAFAIGTKDENDTSEENMEQYKKLRSVIKKALTKQKKHLFDKFRSDEGQWQKWAWIIERKFDDWNIKHRYDHTSKDEKIDLIKVEIINGNTNQSDTSVPEDSTEPSKDTA